MSIHPYSTTSNICSVINILVTLSARLYVYFVSTFIYNSHSCLASQLLALAHADIQMEASEIHHLFCRLWTSFPSPQRTDLPWLSRFFSLFFIYSANMRSTFVISKMIAWWIIQVCGTHLFPPPTGWILTSAWSHVYVSSGSDAVLGHCVFIGRWF